MYNSFKNKIDIKFVFMKVCSRLYKCRTISNWHRYKTMALRHSFILAVVLLSIVMFLGFAVQECGKLNCIYQNISNQTIYSFIHLICDLFDRGHADGQLGYMAVSAEFCITEPSPCRPFGITLHINRK